jgi:hypothetical protein
MSALRFPEWQKVCEDALLEPDPAKLFRRVIVAETAIFNRLHIIANSSENIELESIANMLKYFLKLVANTFILPDGEEKETKRPLQIPNNRLRPN